MIQQAYFGTESITYLVSSIEKLAPRDIFLVTGKSSYSKCGAKDIIEKKLGKYPIHRFFEFDVNPKWEDVQCGLQQINQINPQVIIAIGGGSVLDMAKLIRFFYSYSGEPTGKEFSQFRDIIPLYVIPTTSGTGSEATHFSVLYKDGVKYSVANKAILPNAALLYPPFTYHNTPYLSACTAFDALAQAIEAYWSINSIPESDEYALKAISLLWDNLESVVNHPNEQNRCQVAKGAYWAGRAINIAKTTAPHAFSYQFTSKCGYPHGHAVALTFPFFFELNLTNPLVRDAVDIEKFKVKRETLRKLLSVSLGDEKDTILRIMKSMGLSQFENKNHQDIMSLLSAVNIQRLNNNPVIVNEDVVASLLRYLSKVED